MQVKDNFDAVAILKQELGNRVKQTIVAALTKEYTKQFENEIRERLYQEVAKVSFERIESFRDCVMLRDELKVHIKINEKTYEQ